MARITIAARKIKDQLVGYGIARSAVRTKMHGESIVGEPRLSYVFVDTKHFETVVENADSISFTHNCTVWIYWHKCGKLSSVGIDTAPGGVKVDTTAYDCCEDCAAPEETDPVLMMGDAPEVTTETQATDQASTVQTEPMTYAAWFANTDFRQDDRENPRVRELYTETCKLPVNMFPVRDGHRVIIVVKASAGPCGHKDENGEYCRRTLAAVMYLNGNEGGGRYSRTVHADDGTVHSQWGDCSVIPACPKCGTEDALTTVQEAWADVTTCTTGCGYSNRYSIGD